MNLSFHTILILAYTLPNIYLFIRIWSLFIGREYRFWYAIIYLLLVSVYPSGTVFSERNAFTHLLTLLSDYLMPFFLYLFLSVLIIDIMLLFNRLLKIIPVEKLEIPVVRKLGLMSILLLSLAVVTGGILNFNTIRTSEYRIEIPRKASRIRHLRIAFAADFHLQERTGIHFVRKFACKIDKIKPDIIIFGGDIIEGDNDDGNIRAYESILERIHARYGFYSVPGNHEYYSGQGKGSFFAKAGMELLCDTVVVIDSSFSLAGRCDSHFSGRKSVDELLRSASDSLPLILVDHRPTEIDQVSITNADIQLSGHTHHGQLFPINLITRRVYRLSWGHMKKGNTHFFVTSGIRLWGPPVRTTGKSEIMVIDIDFIGK